MDGLEKQLERIAADLVLVATDDLTELAKLHDSFMEFNKEAGKTGIVATAARCCADLVEEIVLGDVPDKDAALTVLNDAVASLQAIVRDKREPSEVKFPAKLGLADSGTDGEVTTETAETPVVDEPLMMSFHDADTSLLGEFITEAREHCAIAEQKMMDLETGSDNEASINAIFRGFHTIKGAAGFLDMKPVSVLAHESETLLDLARQGSVIIEGRIADEIFAAIDAMRKLFDGVEECLKSGTAMDGTPIIADVLKSLREILKDPGASSGEEAAPRVGDILVEMDAVSQQGIDEALIKKEKIEERLGETLVKQGVVSAKTVAHALRTQKMIRKNKDRATTSAIKEVVKIDTERLDRLVDTIGELVIAESMIGQDEKFLAIAPPHICKNVSHLNKITRELQEMGMAMRLVPVRPAFQKLARAVRDLTKKSGKNIELIMSGEDSEVDRSIVQGIGDPLMHMVRNAVDHAIEMPEERLKAGKSETGHVWLRAYHKGGNIHFDIEDDGRGLDREKIMAKACEKGLAEPNKELSDKEIHKLILLPGFSTAKTITDVSGRGVGMDVVKKNIDAMRGHLEVESTAHEGTKFSMKLPLTLAIIDGMLVRIGKDRYIIPTMSVVESMVVSKEKISTIGNRREMINLRGRLIPLIRTAKLFDQTAVGKNDSGEVVVVVEDGRKLIGLVVDELLGQRQTVIKNLGTVFASRKWVSGAAIMSDGRIGLIIDINGVVQLAGKKENGNYEKPTTQVRRSAPSTEACVALN